MAYQNISTPRFYIDYLTYWNHLGFIKDMALTRLNESNGSESIDATGIPIGLSPSKAFTIPSDTLSSMGRLSISLFLEEENAIYRDEQLLASQESGWMGVFGHNMGGQFAIPDSSYNNCRWALTNIVYFSIYNSSVGGITNVSDSTIINHLFEAGLGGDVEGGAFPYDGFSMWKTTHNIDNNAPIDYLNFRFQPENNGSTISISDLDISGWTMNSLCWGHYYDMPISPDLNLSMEIEYDGLDTVTTLGGATLTNSRYKGPPSWNNLNPWEIAEHDTVSSRAFARNGRRIWTLKFSSMQDTDLFPSNSLASQWYNLDSDNSSSDYGNDYDDTNSKFLYTIATDNSFVARVLNYAITGTRFIFQPDSNNSQPDQFAICMLDKKSLKMKQTGFKTYSFSLKIKEVW